MSSTSTAGPGWSARLGFDPGMSLITRLAERIRAGSLTLVRPDGSHQVFTGTEAPGLRATLQICRPRLARRLLVGGRLGFAEAYLDGDWDTPDLPALLELALANEAALSGEASGSAPLRLLERLRHRFRANTRRGSRRNISDHYDLGNAFYARWLDPGMTYSAALFERPDQDLAAAQEAKYRRLAEALALGPGQRLLEIGCGWGGFAELAARDYGCRVRAITLSREQHDFAQRRIFAAGLADRVEIALEDYRDTTGAYDRVASIEMFEAVGEENWARYFAVLRDRLVLGGIAGLQVISIEDRRFAVYRRGADFIQRYIFPGGMLPSPSTLAQAIAAAGLTMTGSRSFGPDYARTLVHWRQQFEASWPKIRPLGFDERFRRLWSYYFAYCEAGFRVGAIDVGQYRVVRP